MNVLWPLSSFYFNVTLTTVYGTTVINCVCQQISYFCPLELVHVIIMPVSIVGARDIGNSTGAVGTIINPMLMRTG